MGCAFSVTRPLKKKKKLQGMKWKQRTKEFVVNISLIEVFEFVVHL